MIIYDLDIVRIAVTPNKADAPLIVDANAVLTRSIASKRLQTITGRRGEIAQFCCDIQLPQLSLCHSLKTSKLRYPLP